VADQAPSIICRRPRKGGEEEELCARPGTSVPFGVPEMLPITALAVKGIFCSALDWFCG